MPDDIDEAFNAAYDDLFPEANPGEGAEEEVVEEDQPEGSTGPEIPEATEDEVTEPTEDDEPVEEEQSTPVNVIDVTEEDTIRLPDGTEVSLKDAALRQADYTRKTQQLAEERRELEAQQEQFQAEAQEVSDLYERMSEWYETRSANPAGWVQEIISGTDNPTVTLARALKSLVDAGQLDEEFVEVFGLKGPEVRERAKDGESDERVARIEAELEERRQAEEAAKQQAAIVAEYQSQWRDVVSQNELTFADQGEERAAWLELLQFARDAEITDLRRAYAAMAWERAKQQPAEAPKPTPVVSPNKQASRAMTPRSASGSGQPTRPAPVEVEDAARLALDEFISRAG